MLDTDYELFDSPLHYMSVDDVNKTFETTFNFIKTHQVDKDGRLRVTNLYTSIALLDNQGTLVNAPRNTAVNLIFGTVVDVTKTSVVLLTELMCDGITKYEQYTVSYDTILNLISPTLETYRQAYIQTLEKLPPILPQPNHSTYDLLKALDEALADNQNANKYIAFIYDGLSSSFPYNPSGINVIRNIIYVYSQGFIPITKLNGFFFRLNSAGLNNQSVERDLHEQQL